MDFLEGLNPQQREAVTYHGGPLLILAGAGSGKTRVITHRIAHLIQDCNVPPSAIVAVTFTNKAADEMRKRIEKLLAGRFALSGLNVSTFHSFCVRLLRRDGASMADIRPGFTRNFTIYDDDDQTALIKAIYRELGLEEKQFLQYRAALSRISHAKSLKETPEDVLRNSKDPKTTRLATVYEKYEGRLRQANALDFDDLLLEAVRLLQYDDRLREMWNRRVEHLLIDEYQDTNRSQYELMRLLTEVDQNVCVVGDEDQSIYSWRGADIQNILDFERDYPRTRTIKLEQNYRSTKNILEGASSLVARNTQRKGKWLWTEAGEGSKIGLYEGYNGENEALFVADQIERVLRENPRQGIAVLYRTNFQSRQIEEALRRYGRKYQVVGGFSFYQRAEIKDALAYLKLLVSPQDSVSLMRVINTPARGIGKTTMEQIEHYSIKHGIGMWDALGRMLDENAFSTRAGAALADFRKLIEELRQSAATQKLQETVRQILDRSGYMKMLEAGKDPDSETRVENLSELENAAIEAAERGEGVTEFLDHAALVSEADSIDDTAQIRLMTVHNAKGLEFPVVFVAGLEDGLFPHSRSLESETAMEEERRLCYVAMTRAEKRLILTWARERRRFGGGMAEPSVPSRFLSEIPKERTERLGGAAPAAREVDLYADRYVVREAARKNTYTGKTYNSLENISEFFAARGRPLAAPPAAVPVAAAPRVSAPARPAKKYAVGSSIEHPRYGRGTIVRREGDGDDAKITISFPGYGLKKIVEKYLGLTHE
ncbi:MAG TPA: UvrD-helicase domain-containing protein [Bryobacteraceae bacterium]|nr:UvrD-helicase domain-containing protein [Bryobacteraceae bacterium]